MVDLLRRENFISNFRWNFLISVTILFKLKYEEIWRIQLLMREK